MVPLSDPPGINIPMFSELVQVAFSQRRKLIRHTLGRWLEAKNFAGTFDLQRRAQEIPVAEYVALVQQL
jgi:16S rRNA (adenine1518-N6/adenine1519-N6)-dimethyltransferase